MNRGTKTPYTERLLNDRFRVETPLAEGGMSVLYSGTDIRTGRKVAVKLMLPRDFQRAERKKRFEHEIRITSRLWHPNVVQVIASGEGESGEPFLVVEFLRGRSLEEELIQRGKLSAEETLQWLVPLMGALAYAHDHGVVHRDIKPSNIFLSTTEDGRVVPKILDFGISMVSDGTGLTKSGTVVGTVQYMSPEQARDAEVGPQTDVWSMGAVFFRCLAGVVPFEAKAAASLLLKIVRDPLPPLESHAPELKPVFRAAIERALRKNVETRYPDMRSFAMGLCKSANAASVALPESPDPIGLPQWSSWLTYELTDEFATVASKAACVPSGTSERVALRSPRNRVSTDGSPGQPAFVGREKEIKVLLGQFERTASGTGQVIEIVGEAGVGKSRLVSEFVNRLTLIPHRYLEGKCLQRGISTSYVPIRELLRGHFGIRKGDLQDFVSQRIRSEMDALGASIQSAMAPIHDLFSVDFEDTSYSSLDPWLKRDRTFKAIADILTHISQQTPLIIAIEDLHWIDKSSEAFLEYVVSSIASKPILLILLYREQYTPPWNDKADHIVMHVNPLGTDSRINLLRSIFRGEELSKELLELFLHQSGGNPLHVEELAYTLLESGLIQKRGNLFCLDVDASSIELPDSLQEIIAGRIERLEDNLKRTIQIASVIGPDFGSDVLQSILGIQQEFRSHLLNLKGMEFIRERDLSTDPSFAFKHALTREVAYSTLVNDTKKEFHDKTGRTFESMYSERLEDFYETLAYHFTNAENWEKAIHYQSLSGNKALGSFSNNEAVGYYEQAIQALSCLPSTTENKRVELEIRGSLSIALTLLGYARGWIENVRAVERLATELSEEKILLLVRSGWNMYYNYRGESQKVQEDAERDYAQAWETNDTALITLSALALCENYGKRGEHQKLVDLVLPVVELLEASDSQGDYFNMPFNPYLWLCGRLGSSMLVVGQPEKGKTFCDKALRVAEEDGHVLALYMAHFGLGAFWSFRNCGECALEHGLKCEEYYEELQLPVLYGDLCVLLGWGYSLCSDLDRALVYGLKAKEAMSGPAPMLSTNELDMFLAATYYELGKLDQAEEYMIRCLQGCRNQGDIFNETIAMGWLGCILWRQDSVGAAETTILEAMRRCDDLQFVFHIPVHRFLLAELYIQTGRLKEGIPLLRQVERELTLLGEGYYVHRARELLTKHGEDTGF